MPPHPPPLALDPRSNGASLVLFVLLCFFHGSFSATACGGACSVQEPAGPQPFPFGFCFVLFPVSRAAAPRAATSRRNEIWVCEEGQV